MTSQNLVPIPGDQPTSEYRNTSISKQTHFKETAAPVYPNNISTKNINMRLFMDFETSNEITTPRNTALRDTPENNTRGTLFLYCTSVEYLLITFDKRLRINVFLHDILGVSKQNVSIRMSTVRNVTPYIVMKSGFASPNGTFYSGDQISNAIFDLLFI